MQPVIAAIDGSDTARNAAFYAAELARTFKTSLTLITIVSIPVYSSELPVSADELEALGVAAMNELKELKQLLELKTEGRVAVCPEIKYGMLSDNLMEMALRLKPIMIVMGLDNYRHPLMSSNSHSVSATYRLPCPVLVVPDNVPYHPIHKVAIACDLKEPEDTIPIKWLETLLDRLHPALCIANVNREHIRFDADKSQASLFLQKHLGRFFPAFHFLIGNSVEKELDAFCHSHQIDLLIIIPKKHKALSVFDPRHVGKIMYHQNIPTLAMHNDGSKYASNDSDSRNDNSEIS